MNALIFTPYTETPTPNRMSAVPADMIEEGATNLSINEGIFGLAPLQPRLNVKDGANDYHKNLMMTPSRDLAILPSGGGHQNQKTQGTEKVWKGSFVKIDMTSKVRDREAYLKNIGKLKTITQAKLPTFGVISKELQLQEQPAINMADASETQLADVSPEEQEDLLGREDAEMVNDEEAKEIEQMNEVQQNLVQPYLPNKMSRPNKSKMTKREIIRFLQNNT